MLYQIKFDSFGPKANQAFLWAISEYHGAITHYRISYCIDEYGANKTKYGPFKHGQYNLWITNPYGPVLLT